MSGGLLLVTGGARSGKSRYAEARIEVTAGPVLFVATGVATDSEMADRIARHRAERPAGWQTLEARYELAARIAELRPPPAQVLVEDVGTLVANLLVEREADERAVSAEIDALIWLAASPGPRLVVVSQEVGLGLVPETPLGRQFRDLLGLANQRLASAAAEVVLLVAGQPLRIKG